MKLNKLQKETKLNFLKKQFEKALETTFALELDDRIWKRELIRNPTKKINVGQQSIKVEEYLGMIARDLKILDEKLEVINDEISSLEKDLSNNTP